MPIWIHDNSFNPPGAAPKKWRKVVSVCRRSGGRWVPAAVSRKAGGAWASQSRRRPIRFGFTPLFGDGNAQFGDMAFFDYDGENGYGGDRFDFNDNVSQRFVIFTGRPGATAYAYSGIYAFPQWGRAPYTYSMAWETVMLQPGTGVTSVWDMLEWAFSGTKGTLAIRPNRNNTGANSFCQVRFVVTATDSTGFSASDSVKVGCDFLL
jgi:hypothetical protein